MTSTSIQRPILQLALLLLLIPAAVKGQESAAPDTAILLRDALLVSVDLVVSTPDGSEELWNSQVDKITIPGRSVNVGIEGRDSKLNVVLTPYPTENGGLLLVARNEIWIAGEYSQGLTTLPIAYRDKVYYYPLGRAGEGSDGTPVEVRMVINIIPYLDTLDESDRAAIESAFDSSTEFNLSEEGD